MTEKIEDYVSVTEAAKIIGCTTGRVRQMLLSQLMDGRKVGERMWIVHREEAERIRNSHASTGRPRNANQA